MKLRIKGNSIRLRLSQAEVGRCATDGCMGDRLHLPGNSDLKYAVGYAPDDSYAVTFVDSQLTVLVPKIILDRWAESDHEIGIYATVNIDEAHSIQITIEKDFQCLTERPGEDESGLYPNPNSRHDGGES